MCYKGKCLMCIPVENGCLVLAILSAIATGLVLLASVITGILIAAGIIFAASEAQHMDMRPYPGFGPWNSDPRPAVVSTAVMLGGIAAGIFVLILGVASLIAFIFSVLLCNGICKRRPGQVKAYFIYGVTITVLAVIAAIIALCTSGDGFPGIATLIGCVIYSLFLVLVHQTYSKLLEGAVFKDHIRLVES